MEEELEYTEKDWEEECSSGKRVCELHKKTSLGTCNLPCPSCNVVGFYGPRGRAEENFQRKYRACKFCGFWQEAFGDVYNNRGGKPYYCKMIKCNCDDEYGKYNWIEPWSSNLGHCRKCDSDYIQCEWPAKDLSHPFHKLKAEIERIHKLIKI
jgi:hypothetical protein